MKNISLSNLFKNNDYMNLFSPNFSDIKEPNIVIKKFPDGDNYVKVPGNCSNSNITLYHRLYPNQDESLIQAVLITKLLKEKGCKITLVSPYLPYSRQDKIWEKGEALSSKYICDMLSWAGVDKLITFDCHFLKKEGTFNYGSLKIENKSMAKKLINYAKKFFGKEDFLILSPDLGSNYMVGKDGSSMKKVRGDYDSSFGKEVYRSVKTIELTLDVNKKNVLIIDDMIAGGGTMIKAVEKLKQEGAKKIVCCATHGFFLKNSLDKLEKLCDKVFVSNTIPSKVSTVDFIDVL